MSQTVTTKRKLAKSINRLATELSKKKRTRKGGVGLGVSNLIGGAVTGGAVTGGATSGGKYVKGRPHLMTPAQKRWRDVVSEYYANHHCTYKQALIACKGR
jgi:hypothetical protein